MILLDSLQRIVFETNACLLPNPSPCLFQVTKDPEFCIISACGRVCLQPGKERMRRLGRERGFYLRQQRVGFLTLVSIHQSKGRRRPPGRLAPLWPAVRPFTDGLPG